MKAPANRGKSVSTFWDNLAAEPEQKKEYSEYVSRIIDELDGKEWIKGEYHRIYINDLWQYTGLKVQTYGTGRVKAAWMDGEKISNSDAGRIQSSVAYGKVWYDVKAEEWHAKNCGEYKEKIIDKIKAQLA